jgi:Tol biopolymer transport system component
LYDVKNQTTKNLNTDNGAGFQFQISENGKTVVYKSYIMDKSGKRQSSIYEQDIATGNKKAIIENTRGLGAVSYLDGNLLYMQNNQVKVHLLKSTSSSSTLVTAVFTDIDLNLVLLKDNKKIVLNPLGIGNYIWVSLSPDKQKILFNKTGKGTFVCNLKGEIIADLGRLHAAKWTNDGNWVIGMNDFDDGQQYTASQIVLSSADGKTRQSLELKYQKIALFPDISPDYSKIVFNDEKGKLYIIDLKKTTKQ